MGSDGKMKLLETAMRLFAADGYAAVSIRRIAEESGVNSALISYHFKGKEGLYRAVIENHVHLMTEFLKTVRAERIAPREVLRAYGRTMLRVHQASPLFSRILCRELLQASPSLQGIVEAKGKPIFQELCKALQEGVREKAFRADLDIEKTVLTLVGCINFYFVSRPISRNILEQDDAFATAYVEQALDIFLSGIERRD